MRWYDAVATPNFLVLYANTIQEQLHPLSDTVRHPVATTTTSVLNFHQKKGFHVISTLDYVSTTSHYKYMFFMRTELPLVLVIKSESVVMNVATHGIITRILKFFYQGTIIMILLGPRDSKLVRFRYDFNPKQLVVVDNFRPKHSTEKDVFPLDEDVWDDLVYVDDSQPTRLAINQKSVANKLRFFVLDLLNLSTISLPLTAFTEEERRAYRQRQKEERRVAAGGRELTTEERTALMEVRKRANNNEPLDEKMKFSDLTAMEEEEMRRLLFIIEPQDPSLYYTISYRPILPFAPDYKFDQSSYKMGQYESLGWRIIRVPGERREDRVHLAVLSRKYINQQGAYTIILRMTGMVKNPRDGKYQPGEAMSVEVDLERMESIDKAKIRQLMDRGGGVVVKEFNVIFHENNACQVEVAQLTMASGHIKMMTSRGFLFTPEDYTRKVDQTKTVTVRDGSFFALMARHHYKIYDYRHDTIANRMFECIFAKYDYERKEMRLIVYKRQEMEGLAPAISDSRIKLAGPGIRSITPMHLASNLFYICFEAKPQKVYKVALNENRHLVSLPEKYDLSASLTRMSIEGDATHCVFCGKPEARKDTESNHFYCTSVCKYIFSQTRAM